MNAVKQEGVPDGSRDLPTWPLIVAVAAAAAVLGYLFGATNPLGTLPSLWVEEPLLPASPTPGAALTTTPTDVSDAAEPEATALRDLVPGLDGTLVVHLGSHSHSEVARWPVGRSAPLRNMQPGRIYGMEPDIRGIRFAALQSSASGPLVLQAGRADLLVPVAFGVTSFAWHQSVARRLAWVEATGDLETAELRTGELDISEPFLRGLRVVGSVAATDRLLAWDEWGFLLAHIEPSEPYSASVYILDQTGDEQWRTAASSASTSSSGRLLISRLGPDRELLVVDASTAAVGEPRVLDWAPPDALPVALSPDGERLALLLDGIRLEVWRLDGTVLRAFDVPGGVVGTELGWTEDGRYVVGPLYRPPFGGPAHLVAFFDTRDGHLHEVEFDMWVWRAVVVQPREPREQG